ncbi:MAG: hypothetical protein V1703_04110 [Candidatus Altiarchaeota archaeon]
MTERKAYALMDLVPGKTLNELAYMNPDLIEENRIRIAFQLGMHAAFGYVFGLKDGYQANYLFDTESKTITRIDNERFLNVPEDPENTLKDRHHYAHGIAACELENLKYIPSFRHSEGMDDVLTAFNTGFLEKYREIKEKRERLLRLIEETRGDALRVRPDVDENDYARETKRLMDVVGFLINQDPQEVLKRLYKAKAELKQL